MVSSFFPQHSVRKYCAILLYHVIKLCFDSTFHLAVLFANAQKRGTLAHTGVLRFVLQTPPYCFNIKSRLPNTKSEIKWIYFYSSREKCMHAVEERGLVMTDASLFEGARFSFYSVTCNMMHFARAFIWNKDSGNSCGKSVIIGTFIHTFLTTLICMIHSNLVNTFWMPDYLFWVEAPCNLLEHVEIHFVFGVYSQKYFLRMDSCCLFVSVWVVGFLCVSQETRCIILFISSLIRDYYGDHTVMLTVIVW